MSRAPWPTCRNCGSDLAGKFEKKVQRKSRNSGELKPHDVYLCGCRTRRLVERSS